MVCEVVVFLSGSSCPTFPTGFFVLSLSVSEVGSIKLRLPSDHFPLLTLTSRMSRPVRYPLPL